MDWKNNLMASLTLMAFIFIGGTLRFTDADTISCDVQYDGENWIGNLLCVTCSSQNPGIIISFIDTTTNEAIGSRNENEGVFIRSSDGLRKVLCFNSSLLEASRYTMFCEGSVIDISSVNVCKSTTDPFTISIPSTVNVPNTVSTSTIEVPETSSQNPTIDLGTKATEVINTPSVEYNKAVPATIKGWALTTALIVLVFVVDVDTEIREEVIFGVLVGSVYFLKSDDRLGWGNGWILAN